MIRTTTEADFPANDDVTRTQSRDASSPPTSRGIPRRSFLGGLATAGTLSPLRGAIQDNGGDDGEDVEVHFEFGARVEGWEGQSPSEIEGEQNPTLDLEPGTQYRVTWENLDGVDHDFTILDADGNEVTGTETVAEQGETLSLTFTASEEMTEYVCTIHPNRMRGAIQVGEDTQADETPTEAEDVAAHIQLAGQVDGWEGVAPDDIEGKTNPTLDVEAGSRYQVTWENTDGVQHSFAILDGEGNPIESTEITSGEGESRTLVFTATREMAQYYCSIHTDAMRGEVQVGEGTPEEETPTEAEEDVDVRYELGAVIGGWQGRLPEERGAEHAIEGEQNPTLTFEAGNRYLVVWENADGAPHNFTIRDAEGNSLLATETTDQQGEKQRQTFTARAEMDDYVCTIHPETMRGEIEVSGGDESLFAGPEGTLGAVAAATAGIVAGLSYTLSRYFDDSHEP